MKRIWHLSTTGMIWPYVAAAVLITATLTALAVVGRIDVLGQDVFLHFSIVEAAWTAAALWGCWVAVRAVQRASKDVITARNRSDPYRDARLLYTTQIRTRNWLRVGVFVAFALIGILYGTISNDSPLFGVPRLGFALTFFFVVWEIFYAVGSEEAVSNRLDQLLDELGAANGGHA